MKVFLLLLSIGAFSAQALSAVGFEQLSVPDPPRKALSLAVWFPSVGRSVSSSVGPFQQMVVPDGTVLGTGLPLILISHGSREMPVWGPFFHQVEGDQDFGHVRLENLVKYVQSIQQK